MPGVTESVVTVAYVGELDRSVRFYGLFGFTELQAGADGGSRWAHLGCGPVTLLLAAVQPPLVTVELPLQMYLYVDDLAAVTDRATAAGHVVEHVGYPRHAPGGEARVVDPDGNAILIGQRTAVAQPPPDKPYGARFSLVRQAAEAAARRGGAPARCQVGTTDGDPCPRPAEVKLADSWGDTIWACTDHADETLILARGAFLASEDPHGLGPFLRRRHQVRTADADRAGGPSEH